MDVSLILFHALTFQAPPSYKCCLPLQGPYSSNIFSGLVFPHSDEDSARVAAVVGFSLHPLSFYCRRQCVQIKSTHSLCWTCDNILATKQLSRESGWNGTFTWVKFCLSDLGVTLLPSWPFLHASERKADLQLESHTMTGTAPSLLRYAGYCN